MIRKRNLSVAQIAQLFAIVPVSLAALVEADMGAIGLGGVTSDKSASAGLPVASGLFVLPLLAVGCLWVAILSNNVAVVAGKQAFFVVWAGLILGCVLAGFLVVAFTLKGRDGGSVVLYRVPFAIGAWHLYRLTRTCGCLTRRWSGRER